MDNFKTYYFIPIKHKNTLNFVQNTSIHPNITYPNIIRPNITYPNITHPNNIYPNITHPNHSHNNIVESTHNNIVESTNNIFKIKCMQIKLLYRIFQIYVIIVFFAIISVFIYGITHPDKYTTKQINIIFIVFLSVSLCPILSCLIYFQCKCETNYCVC